MRIIKAKVSEIVEPDILKKIERCGRVCYKSEGQISEGSALRFVTMIIKNNHLAMTEHAPIVLRITKRIAHLLLNLGHGTFLNVTMNGAEERYIASGNVRAWINVVTMPLKVKYTADLQQTISVDLQKALGNELYSVLFGKLACEWATPDPKLLLTQQEVLDLPNLSEEEAKAHLYLTAHFICDRGVSHELVRHRPASFAQESTRYCNYLRESFGKTITYIDPGFKGESYHIWLNAMLANEETYFKLLEMGFTPQQARGVLTTDVKTEVIMTCNLAEWQHVINLRYHGTTGAPHPHMLQVMELWYNLVKAKEGYNKWID